MIEQSNLAIIWEVVNDFFSRTTFLTEIEIKEPQGLTIPIEIKTDEPQIMIGEGGQTLLEVQHLLKAILRRKISEPFFIDLDVNNYKKNKIEYLKEMARSAADEVAITKKEKTLAPMPAYERRIIHLEIINNRSDVITESLGEGAERKVTIKPIIAK